MKKSIFLKNKQLFYFFCFFLFSFLVLIVAKPHTVHAVITDCAGQQDGTPVDDPTYGSGFCCGQAFNYDFCTSNEPIPICGLPSTTVGTACLGSGNGRGKPCVNGGSCDGSHYCDPNYYADGTQVQDGLGNSGVCCSGKFVVGQTSCSTCTPVNGGWGGWSVCDGVSQSRQCNNPAPACGGQNCQGPSTAACTIQTCTVTGHYCQQSSLTGQNTGYYCITNTCPEDDFCSFLLAACPITGPVISLDPRYFTFYDTLGNPPTTGLDSNGNINNVLSITNTGNQDLHWQAGTDSYWCHISPPSGTTSPGFTSSATVSVDPWEGVPGNYGCSVTVSDASNLTDPKVVGVGYVVTPGSDNASCQNFTAPSTVTAGQQVPFSVTMSNNGGTNWTGRSVNHNNFMYLGINPWNGSGFGNMIYVDLPGTNQTVYPGGSADFISGDASAPVIAPATTGTYTFSWIMGHQGAEGAFGQACSQQIIVTPASVPSIQLSPSSFEFYAISGSSTPPSQSMTIADPTGGTTLKWKANTDQVWCHVSPATGTAPASSPSTVSVSVDAPSNTGTFNCTVTVSDNGSSPPAVPSSATAAVTYTVSNNGLCQSMAVPASVTAGTVVPFTVTMQNNSQANWIPRPAGNFMYLGINPWSGGPFGAGIYIDLPGNATVTPSTSVTFNGSNSSAQVIAPATPGPYTFSWIIGQEGGPDWTFGQACSQQITVTAAVAPHISLASPPYIFNGVSGSSTPVSQTMTISDTVSGTTLQWSATPVGTGSWCHVSPTSGTAPFGSPSTVTINVDSPSNVGSFNNCSIQISDNGSTPPVDNAPQTAGVTYNVVRGDASNLLASAAVCGQIGLTWTAGSQANSYIIFRNTVNNSDTANPIAAGVVGTSYNDTTAVVGINYFYWIQTTGGTGDFVPANTNSTGGIGATSCTTNGPNTLTLANACNPTSEIDLTWSNELNGTVSSYRVYRNSSNNFGTATRIAQNIPPATDTYRDTTVTGGQTYYYWVTGVISGVETNPTAASNNPEGALVCGPNLADSDKDIVAVNGNLVNPPPASCNSHTDALPATLVLKQNDVLGFQINLCNDQGTATATLISLTDNLLNFQQPLPGWQIKYNNVTVPNGQITVSGSVPNQTLTINLPGVAIAPGAIAKLTFNAQLTIPLGFTGTSARFQNSFNISYQGGNQLGNTPLLPFYIGNNIPTINEVP